MFGENIRRKERMKFTKGNDVSVIFLDNNEVIFVIFALLDRVKYKN